VIRAEANWDFLSSLRRLAFAVALGLTILWCTASLWFPLGWDQGMFASVGDVILRGGMPYRDGWETRGPLAFYVFATAESLFGRHMWSVRILDLLLLAAGMLGLHSIVRRLITPSAGYWAAFMYVFWVGHLTWFHTAEPDAWMAIFIILAAVPSFDKQAPLSGLIFSGVMVGCAALIKPFSYAFLAVPFAGIVWRRPFGKKSLVRCGAVAGAALVPALAAAAWFGYRGALGDLIDVHLLYPAKVYSRAPGIGAEVRGLMRFFVTAPVLLVLPVVLVGIFSLWRRRPAACIVTLTWAAVALAGAAAQAKFFSYHWLPLFAPMVILGAMGFESVMHSAGSEKKGAVRSMHLSGRIALALAIVGIVQMALVPASSVVQWLKLTTSRINLDQYYAAHTASWFAAGDVVNAAKYIGENTNPSDGLAVFGNEALLNFLSGRANPTRFLTGGSLTLGGPNSIRNAYRQEYIRGLQRTPPAYIVLGMAYDGTKERALHDFPQLEQFLRERYSLEKSFGYLDLYHENALKDR